MGDDLLKLDSKLGFLSEFAGVVQARASRSAVGTANTVAEAASQERRAFAIMVTVLW